MPTRFWQVPHLGLTAHSAILTARRTVCHTAPLRNVVPLLASPPPDTSPTAPKTTPPLCVRLFPYPLLSASQPPANTLLYAVSTSLCSPLLRATATCAIPLRIRKVPIRKNRTGRPDVHIVVRTLRSPETGCFPHSPPRRPKRNDPKAAPQTQKKRPHNVRAPCPMLREKRSVAEKITSRYRS